MVWGWRDAERARSASLQELEERASAVAAALEGSVRAQVRRGRCAVERLQAVFDSVVQAARLDFVALVQDERLVAGSGEVPVRTVLAERSSGLQTERCYVHFRSVQLEDRRGSGKGRGGHGVGRLGRWSGSGQESAPQPEVDFAGRAQELVVGVSATGHLERVAGIARRFWLTAGLAVAVAVVLLAVWAVQLHNRDLQAKLAASRVREEDLRELSLAAAGLAHEAKNPLGIARTLAQQLHDGIREPHEAAEQILDELDVATARLGGFMAYAKPQAPARVRVEVASLVAELLAVLEPDSEAAGVTIVADCEGTVEADPEMLRQILVNLLLNSIEASSAGGVIRVELTDARTEASLTVRDEGCGIAPERRTEVFKPYVSDREGGHGLGLAIVRRLVEAHGWRVAAEANAPCGTVIRIDGMR